MAKGEHSAQASAHASCVRIWPLAVLVPTPSPQGAWVPAHYSHLVDHHGLQYLEAGPERD